jgi:hypothetical protein
MGPNILFHKALKNVVQDLRIHTKEAIYNKIIKKFAYADKGVSGGGGENHRCVERNNYKLR